jgi:hypothetical protein
MEREKIIFFRNFFFAAFIIGLIFALFYFGVRSCLGTQGILGNVQSFY